MARSPSKKSSTAKSKKSQRRPPRKSPKPTPTASKRPSTSVGPSGDSKVPRNRTVVHLPGPTKAYADENEYRLIQLPNGIRALLISDQGEAGHPDWHHQSSYSGMCDHDPIPMNASPFNPGFWNPTGILRPVSRWSDPSGNPVFQEGFILRTNPLRPDRDLYLDPTMKIFGDKDRPAISLELDKPYKGQRKRSAALSMSISVGTVNDPVDHNGLAHFCEHMVHFGSKSYPQEDTFVKLVTDYGDGLGAFTTFMTTTYHFSVTDDKIEKGLDVFSNMMAFPTFAQDSINREVNAVDNEFMLKRHWDFLRWYYIFLRTANANHPLNNFPCGNLQTLRHLDDPNGLAKLQTALRAFHKKHYVGSAITLSLQSSASLDEMENMVFDNFSKIPEGDRKIRQLLEVEKGFEAPFDNPKFNKFYLIRGQQQDRHLMLTWAFPAEAWKDSINKPMDFLGVLMNDEWAGGLPYYLRNQGWINDYSAGCQYGELSRNEYTSLFQIQMVTTAEGMDKYTDIVQAVFAYIKRIETIPLAQKQNLWREMHTSTFKFFNFSGPGDSTNLTVQSSRSLQSYPGTDIFCAEKCYGPSYDDGVMMKYLALMTSSRINVMMIVPEAEQLTRKMKFPLKEPFSGGEYAVQEFTAPFMKSLQSVKPLGVKNSIMPRNLYVHDTVADAGFIEPQKIAESSKFHIEHRGQTASSVFKARCVVQFASGVCNNIRSCTYLSLFGHCLQQTLLDDVSPVQRSGNDIVIRTSGSRLTFDVCGFSHAIYTTLEELLPKVFDAPIPTVIPEAMFNTIKGLYLSNFNAMKNNNRAIFSRIMYELQAPNAHSWDAHQKILESLNYKGFQSFVQLFKSSSFALGMIAGNSSVEDGHHIAWILDNLSYRATIGNWFTPTLGVNSLESLPDNRCIRARNPSPIDPNTVVINIYDLGHRNDKQTIEIGIFLGKFMQPRMFHMLRTERQLGYVVASGVGLLLDSIVLNLQVVYPSYKRTACEVDQAMDGFLVNVYHRYLKDMTQKEFSVWKQNLELSDSLALQDVHTWYTKNILDVIKVNKTTGLGEWRDIDNFGIIRKLSVQVLGSNVEKCKGIRRCKDSQETRISSSEKSIVFAKDAKNAIRPYFISNIQDFKNSPEE